VGPECGKTRSMSVAIRSSIVLKDAGRAASNSATRRVSAATSFWRLFLHSVSEMPCTCVPRTCVLAKDEELCTK